MPLLGEIKLRSQSIAAALYDMTLKVNPALCLEAAEAMRPTSLLSKSEKIFEELSSSHHRAAMLLPWPGAVHAALGRDKVEVAQHLLWITAALAHNDLRGHSCSWSWGD